MLLTLTTKTTDANITNGWLPGSNPAPEELRRWSDSGDPYLFPTFGTDDDLIVSVTWKSP